MGEMIFFLLAEFGEQERTFKENTVYDYLSGILIVVKFLDR